MDLWKRKFCPFAESVGSEASGFSAKEKSGFKWESDQLELLLLWVCLLWDISLPTPLEKQESELRGERGSEQGLCGDLT